MLSSALDSSTPEFVNFFVSILNSKKTFHTSTFYFLLEECFDEMAFGNISLEKAWSKLLLYKVIRFRAFAEGMHRVIR